MLKPNRPTDNKVASTDKTKAAKGWLESPMFACYDAYIAFLKLTGYEPKKAWAIFASSPRGSALVSEMEKAQRNGTQPPMPAALSQAASKRK